MGMFTGVRNARAVAVALVLIAATLLPAIAAAQAVVIPDEYGKKIKLATDVSPLGADAFGDSTNPATGRTVFSTFDISLPGNSALPVRFGRRLNIDFRYMPEELGGVGNWDMEVPYIEGAFSGYYGWSVAAHNSPDRYKRCSKGGAPMIEGGVFTPEEINHGYNVHIPGELDAQMLVSARTYTDPTDGQVYPWVLENQARVSCLSTVKNGYPGEGFLLRMPDGTKYFFDYPVERTLPTLRKAPKIVPGYSMARKRVFLLATRIEDRFGNAVTYQYSGDKLVGISGSDGRQITIQHGPSGITASANGRTWTYTLSQGYLVGVRNPDGSEWRYSPFGSLTARPDDPGDSLAMEAFLPENSCLDQSTKYGGQFSLDVTHPSGAKATFEFTATRITRSHVRYLCFVDALPTVIKIPNSDMESPEDIEVSGVARIGNPNFFDLYALTGKTVQGDGVSPMQTRFEYPVEAYPYCDYFSSVTGLYEGVRCHEPQCASGDCADSVGRWVTTILPTGDRVRRRYGVIHGKNEGRLIAEQYLDANGTLLREVNHQYVDDATTATQAFPQRIGWGLTVDPTVGLNRPQVRRETIESGTTFTWQVGTCGASGVFCFDSFARPSQVEKHSSLGYSKVEVTEYEDNTSLWVLGLVRRQTLRDTQPNGVAPNVQFTTLDVEYDSRAMPHKVRRNGRLDQTATYWSHGLLNTVADGLGNTTTYSDYVRGIPTRVAHAPTAEAPAGATLNATVDANGWITSVTNEVGGKTCYAYDVMGRITRVTHPSGTQAGVCDGSRWTEKTYEFRRLAEGEWMPIGVPMSRWRAVMTEGNRTTITYLDALWRPVLMHDYDASNTAGTLRSTRKAYDLAGRESFTSYPTSQLIPGMTGTRTAYDGLGRVTRVEQDSELGVLATTNAYIDGLRVRTTNPRGQQSVTHHMAWDTPGYELPTTSLQPEGKLLQIVRHPRLGVPLAMTQGASNGTQQVTRRYVYDGHGRLCKTLEPETGATVMGHDAASNVTWTASGLDATTFGSLTDCQHGAAYGAGRTVTRTYDAQNRPASITFPDGRGNQSWTYTADGLVASTTVANGTTGTEGVTTAYTYNSRRLLTGEAMNQHDWYTWSIGYEYDGAGQPSRIVYPTGLAVNYQPNALGQPTQVTDNQGRTYASGVEYHPNGSIKRFTYGNGVLHTMQQNARQLPSRVTASGGVMDFSYGYDQNANITNIWDLARGDNFSRWMTYDNLDRLTSAGSASFGGDAWHRFTYDAVDNLRSWKLAGVKDYADYVYDQQNQLMSIRNSAGATVVGFAYDAQGNVRNKNGQLYDFDFGNRLRAATGVETYRYDGLGRRVLTTAPNGATKAWLYSQSGQMLFWSDWDGAGYLNQKTHDNIYLQGSVIATLDRAWPSNAVLAVNYQHTDMLGSPVAVTNASGQVTERNDYEPYGAIIGKPTRSGIGYTGHVMDGGTGLTYMQQRYYDQSVGRFLSVDPITAVGSGDMRFFNRYLYANGNPFTYVDPDGRAGKRRDGSNFAELGILIAEALGWISHETADGMRAGVTDGKLRPQPSNGGRSADNRGGPKPKGQPRNGARQATAGPRTLQPGPYAGQSVPARGPARDFTPGEREQVNEIGRASGCHTCGTTDPGTKSGNFVPDHQPPSATNTSGAPQQLYPQCVGCSRTQGGEVRQRKPPPPPEE